jgi:putative flippase GtrA
MDIKNNILVRQFGKFVVVGLINTTIYFIILNVLSAITKITMGNALIPLVIVAFVVATTNSYFLNKRWAFSDKSGSDNGRKFSLFLLVSIVGAVINTSIVRLISTNIHPLFNLSSHLWLNVAAICATGVSLIWNFIGYKLFVFKNSI